ncbi:UNVERIFIED_CONTAM: Brassinosteroid-responsive RING protein 1 [Sesamum radiatum]|uniref:Brassinosteroid-responsive RING protein 1 n=1 Tax=Sesamum radiatum TaxID=300843 RepID=A0AAW2QG00_SESRA
MRALAKLFSCSIHKILAVFPGLVLRLTVLAVCVLWKNYRHLSSTYKYTSLINKKSSTFAYRKRAEPELVEFCSICLSEFAEGDVGRELVDCKHVFHRHCLEKWLQRCRPTCPLCRSLVVPEVVVAEYHRLQIEWENDGLRRNWLLSC